MFLNMVALAVYQVTLLVLAERVLRDANTSKEIFSHVLNEQGTGYQHIFSSVQTFNID